MTGAIDWSHVAKYLRAVHGLTCPLASRLQPRLQLDELGCASSFESSDCFGNNGGQAQTQGTGQSFPIHGDASSRLYWWRSPGSGRAAASPSPGRLGKRAGPPCCRKRRRHRGEGGRGVQESRGAATTEACGESGAPEDEQPARLPEASGSAVVHAAIARLAQRAAVAHEVRLGEGGAVPPAYARWVHPARLAVGGEERVERGAVKVEPNWALRQIGRAS